MLALFVLLLAGCQNTPQKRAHNLLDWQSAEFVPAAAAAPRVEVSPPAAIPSHSDAITNQSPEISVPFARWRKTAGLCPPACLAAAPLPPYALNPAHGILLL